MDVIKEITEIVDKLDELEIYESGLSQLLSECDERELQMYMGNKISILTSLTSMLERLMNKKVITREDLANILNLLD